MKRSVKMTILLSVLVIVSGGLLVARNVNQSSVVSEEEGHFALTEHTAEDVVGLTWTKEGKNYHFIREDDNWINADDNAFPTSQSGVQSLADSVAGLEATRRIENVQNVEDYGLNDEAFTASVEWSDNTQTKYTMGGSTPFEDGYYLQLNDDTGTIYTIGSSLSWIFDVDQSTLAEMEEIPQVEKVTRLVIGMDLDASWKESSSSLNPEQHWYSTETDEALDDSMIGGLIDDIREVSWDSLVEVSPTGEQLASWNLDDAATEVTLYNGDDSKLTLKIGATDDTGNYYACLADSSMVYTISSDSVASLMEIEMDSLRVSDLIPLDQSNLKEAVFRTANGSWTIERTETEVSQETNETEEDAASGEEDSADTTGGAGSAESEPKISEVVTINGKAVEADSLDSLWSLVRNITISSYTAADHGDDTLLSVTVVNEFGVREKYEFYAHDVNNYAVSCSDGREVQVSADTIDRIVRSLNQL